MTYYIDKNDGAGPKPCIKGVWTEALITQMISRFGYRYRIREAAVTIIEKVW